MEELTADYVSGVLHPGDMKLALANSLIKILQVTFFSLAWQSSFFCLGAAILRFLCICYD
jgi:hypothetical protein